MPLHFNDETLTKALAKLSLPNFVGANVVFDSDSKEDPLVEVKLKAYNLMSVRKGIPYAKWSEDSQSISEYPMV